MTVSGNWQKSMKSVAGADGMRLGLAARLAFNQPVQIPGHVLLARGFRFGRAAKFARELAQLVLAEGLPQGILLNLNVPLA
jgi:broad specificity polyphosphatase/5'/3'-nucleotidase SurE